MTSTLLTLDERAALRAQHAITVETPFGLRYCLKCQTEAPCVPIRLLDQVEALEAAARDAVAAFRKYCPDRDSRYGQVWQATEDALHTGVVLTEGGYRVEGGPDDR